MRHVTPYTDHLNISNSSCNCHELCHASKTNESRHTYGWKISPHIPIIEWSRTQSSNCHELCYVSHTNESCHTYEGDMSPRTPIIWLSRTLSFNFLRVLLAQFLSVWMGNVTYTWNMSHVMIFIYKCVYTYIQHIYAVYTIHIYTCMYICII